MKSWLASIALHGVLAALVALLWLLPETPTKAQPMRWTVVFTPPAMTPPREKAPEPPPPAPKKIAQPRNLPPPSKLAPPPPPSRQPAPAPAVESQALPVAQARPAVPVPPAPQLVEQPAVAAHASVKTASVDNSASLSRISTGDLPASVPPRSTSAMASSGQTGAEEAAAAERRWYLALLERLQAMKNYPPVARRLGQEGVVLIVARISPDGRLETAQIKKGSGYPLLDREALRLLEAAAETARGQLRPDRPAHVEIPIAYRLEG